MCLTIARCCCKLCKQSSDTPRLALRLVFQSWGFSMPKKYCAWVNLVCFPMASRFISWKHFLHAGSVLPAGDAAVSSRKRSVDESRSGAFRSRYKLLTWTFPVLYCASKSPGILAWYSTPDHALPALQIDILKYSKKPVRGTLWEGFSSKESKYSCSRDDHLDKGNFHLRETVIMEKTPFHLSRYFCIWKETICNSHNLIIQSCLLHAVCMSSSHILGFCNSILARPRTSSLSVVQGNVTCIRSRYWFPSLKYWWHHRYTVYFPKQDIPYRVLLFCKSLISLACPPWGKFWHRL